ncbi:putative myotubularin [Diplonema papillatum]|nr:putative myotubularin [Diplonema papillatum]
MDLWHEILAALPATTHDHNEARLKDGEVMRLSEPCPADLICSEKKHTACTVSVTNDRILLHIQPHANLAHDIAPVISLSTCLVADLCISDSGAEKLVELRCRNVWTLVLRFDCSTQGREIAFQACLEAIAAELVSCSTRHPACHSPSVRTQDGQAPRPQKQLDADTLLARMFGIQTELSPVAAALDADKPFIHNPHSSSADTLPVPPTSARRSSSAIFAALQSWSVDHFTGFHKSSWTDPAKTTVATNVCTKHGDRAESANQAKSTDEVLENPQAFIAGPQAKLSDMPAPAILSVQTSNASPPPCQTPPRAQKRDTTPSLDRHPQETSALDTSPRQAPRKSSCTSDRRASCASDNNSDRRFKGTPRRSALSPALQSAPTEEPSSISDEAERDDEDAYYCDDTTCRNDRFPEDAPIEQEPSCGETAVTPRSGTCSEVTEPIPVDTAGAETKVPEVSEDQPSKAPAHPQSQEDLGAGVSKRMTDSDTVTCANSSLRSRRESRGFGGYRVSLANKGFQLCTSYPEKVIVPQAVSDKMLIASASVRRNGRFPVVNWVDRSTGACIACCSSLSDSPGTPSSFVADQAVVRLLGAAPHSFDQAQFLQDLELSKNKTSQSATGSRTKEKAALPVVSPLSARATALRSPTDGQYSGSSMNHPTVDSTLCCGINEHEGDSLALSSASPGMTPTLLFGNCGQVDCGSPAAEASCSVSESENNSLVSGSLRVTRAVKHEAQGADTSLSGTKKSSFQLSSTEQEMMPVRSGTGGFADTSVSNCVTDGGACNGPTGQQVTQVQLTKSSKARNPRNLILSAAVLEQGGYMENRVSGHEEEMGLSKSGTGQSWSVSNSLRNKQHPTSWKYNSKTKPSKPAADEFAAEKHFDTNSKSQQWVATRNVLASSNAPRCGEQHVQKVASHGELSVSFGVLDADPQQNQSHATTVPNIVVFGCSSAPSFKGPVDPEHPAKFSRRQCHLPDLEGLSSSLAALQDLLSPMRSLSKGGRRPSSDSRGRSLSAREILGNSTCRGETSPASSNLQASGHGFGSMAVQASESHGCESSGGSVSDADGTSTHMASWTESIAQTRWFDHIAVALRAADKVKHSVAKGDSALVICDSGRDWSLLVSSLAMLCLDSHYRTYKGFAELISAEWLQKGHGFQTRCFGAPAHRAPVFLLFLECTWHILRQSPGEFQFNENHLNHLADHTYTRKRGAFLFDSENERQQFYFGNRTASLFEESALDGHKSSFNVLYKPEGGVALSIPTREWDLCIVWSYHLRYTSGFASAGNQTCHLGGPHKRIHDIMSLVVSACLSSPIDAMSLLCPEECTPGSVYAPSLLSPGASSHIRVAGRTKPLFTVRWTPDALAPCCTLCQAAFTFWTRRHHCRACGNIFCSGCSPGRLCLPGLGYVQKVRVCKTCATKHPLEAFSMRT